MEEEEPIKSCCRLKRRPKSLRNPPRRGRGRNPRKRRRNPHEVSTKSAGRRERGQQEAEAMTPISTELVSRQVGVGLPRRALPPEEPAAAEPALAPLLPTTRPVPPPPGSPPERRPLLLEVPLSRRGVRTAFFRPSAPAILSRTRTMKMIVPRTRECRIRDSCS